MSTTCHWNEVTYSHTNTELPLERWGHRMVRISPSQALLFGGFGGETAEGRYLDDLWLFDLGNAEWRRVETTGELPQKRSNYTIHHDAGNNQVVLFGGGALNKLRFNTVWLLDLSTMQWRRVDPNPAEDAPWERTYHCSEFHYPYLISYGGEGVSNIDLDDCWVFNLLASSWRRLEFVNNQEGPGKRRFHSSALIGSHFYIIGGCRDDYHLQGEIHRVDLSSLLTQGATNNFRWQKLMSNCKGLERWGHSSDVYDGKILIFAGRISPKQDTSDILIYQPSSNTLQPFKPKGTEPKPRRRHASLVIGSSLLCFGGYNGKYLKDFHFTTLPISQGSSPKANIINVETLADYEKKMKDYERKVKYNWELELTHVSGNTIIRTNKQALLKNDFFQLMHEYSNGSMPIQLPTFSTVEMFRFMHQLLIEGDAVFCKAHPPSYYLQVAVTLEYFHCSHLIPVIEQHLLTQLKNENCIELLTGSGEFQMAVLKLRCAELALKEGLASSGIEGSDGAWSCQSLIKENDQPVSDGVVKALREVDGLLRFQMQQSELRKNYPNIFARTALQLKNIFQSQSPKEQRETSEKQQQRAGCFSRLLAFLQQLRE